MAGRQDRPGLLQARRQGRQEGNPGARSGRRSNTSRPRSRASLPSKASATSKTCRERLRTLVRSTIAPAVSCGRLFSDLVLYSAEMVPEISDRIVEIDRAMRWGYANKLGPFELWDALGVRRNCRAHATGPAPLPENIRRCSARGAMSLLSRRPIRPAARTTNISICSSKLISRSKPRPALSCSSDVKRAHGVVEEERRRVADRPGRRRSVRRVPQQDELAGRRQHRDDSRRPRGDQPRISKP